MYGDFFSFLLYPRGSVMSRGEPCQKVGDGKRLEHPSNFDLNLDYAISF